jgi:membrane protease subunit (stomatin/prohibitin family)
MTARNIAAAQQQQAQLDAYIRTTAAAGGTADELTKLAALRDQGVITAAEFENQKSKLLT